MTGARLDLLLVSGDLEPENQAGVPKMRHPCEEKKMRQALPQCREDVSLQKLFLYPSKYLGGNPGRKQHSLVVTSEPYKANRFLREWPMYFSAQKSVK